MPLPHATRRVQIWIDVDVGIADLVVYLNTIPDVHTLASCQGTVDEGGCVPPQVMSTWTDEALMKLVKDFDITILGDHWGYVHPRPE